LDEDEVMRRGLADPRMNQVMAEMSKNPKVQLSAIDRFQLLNCLLVNLSNIP
jgi:hypothetical protein